MTRSDGWRVAMSVLIVLFLLQGLRALFSTMFGIIYDQVFAGSPTAWLPVSLLLVAFALLAPVWVPRRPWTGGTAAAIAVCAAARVPLSINDADIRFASSLVVVASALIVLTSLMQAERRTAYLAVAGALAVDQWLRIAGDTYDPSLRPEWLPVQVILSLALIGLALTLPRPALAPAAGQGLPLAAGAALGGVLFLETSLLAVGNAVARWSGASYAVMAPLLLAISTAGALAWNPSASRGGRGLALILTIVLPLALLAGYYAGGLVAAAGLLIAQVSVLASWAFITGDTGSRRRCGASVAAGLAVFLVLNFLNAFAFTYAYTLPLLRGAGPWIYLAAGLLAAIPFWRPVNVGEVAAPRRRPSWMGLGATAASLVIAVVLVWPRPADDMSQASQPRLATYNIHYGYDGVWGFAPEAQADTLRASGADVVALQEVDAGRMTSYMVDNAYYLARTLKMNVAYLPTVEHLTGIAVLYRGTALATEATWLTSLQEQTGIIHVALEADGNPWHAYGIWMGLEDEDTQTQIEEALAFIGDRSPASFGGDFNARPGSPVYQAVAAAGFIDPFSALGIDPAPATSPAVDPQERIDFVWLRGLTPRQAWVPDSVASDHRLVAAEAEIASTETP
jgi:endonuclease/exonuclease/phosphatase family metal-dependent hydrolase